MTDMTTSDNLCPICSKDWYCTCNNKCNKDETK